MGDKKANKDPGGSLLISPKRVIVHFGLFVLVYGLLMVPWPGLQSAYAKFYRAGAAFLFGRVGAKGIVRFVPANDPYYDTNIVFYNRDVVRKDGRMITDIQVPHPTRYAGYMHTALLVALIGATPVSWRRKGWALLWGMILLYGFIILKVALLVINPYTMGMLTQYQLSPFWERVLYIVTIVFVTNLTTGWVVTVFIWILVSFRREDWSRILIQKSPRGA